MRVRERLVDRLLGAAAYEGSPPLGLVTEGLVVAGVGPGLIVGAGVVSVLVGLPPPQVVAAVAVAVAAVALHLLIIRAGHVFVAAVAVLGALLASVASGIAVEAVLTGAGRTQDVVVTTVAYEPAGDPAYYCSVRRQDGSPVEARLWRGCGPSVTPGDLIGMVYDPAGRVAPRGVAGPGNLLKGAAASVLLLFAFAVLCFLAVVRSYRVPSTGSVQPRG
ncbi:hypothetical protein ACFUJR_04835 [Streptomyces sp. NPDC057271]|uniref:hypothetical protein n=1 Tax=unclassified Streptomyces TaxID=2593676 RepID=UPI00363BFB71